LKFCYEAGPRGFALCRSLRSHGLDCILVCPSKVPRKPVERFIPNPKLKFMEQCREAMRFKRLAECGCDEWPFSPI